MIDITLDTETFKFRPGLLAPKMVCLSWRDSTGREGVIDRENGVRFARAALLDPEVMIIGQNIVYDLGVLAAANAALLPLIFDALEAGRIRSIDIRQKLIDIAMGEFKFYTDRNGNKAKTKHSLQQMVDRYFGVHLEKADTWRLRYHELDGIPIHKWPSAAVAYPLADAKWTYDVYLAQDRLCDGPIPTENEQMKAAFALQMMSIWGVRSNPQRVAAVRTRLITERSELEKKLKEEKIIKPDGVKNQKYIKELVEAAFARQGLSAPLTDSGKNISCDKDTLLLADDPLLKLISDHTHIDKLLGTYMPPLVAASTLPFNPNWKILVTSGRTSCGSGEDENESVGNLQNLPRDEDIRACWEARPGALFCSTDYAGAELRSWAQVCLKIIGFSVLAEELKQGLDPNLSFASKRLGMEYGEALRRKEAGDKDIKNARQRAKIAMYGLGGGLGAERFIEYARGYGTILTLEESQEIIRDWKGHYAESRPYFRYISDRTGRSSATITHPITGYVRGDCSYTAASNHLFQHLTAFYAKNATYEVVKESWTGVSSDGEFDGVKNISPLFGARPVIFSHDEIISELPIAIAHEAAYRQALIMTREADKVVTDVPNPVEPALMKNWEKNAEPRFSNGRLVEWTP